MCISSINTHRENNEKEKIQRIVGNIPTDLLTEGKEGEEAHARGRKKELIPKKPIEKTVGFNSQSQKTF